MMTPSAAQTAQLRTVRLRVNGQEYELRIDPATPLIFALRNDLGLKAAKYACGLEQCGACKVLIDGKGRPSCRLPVSQAEGCDIVTLEGIGAPDRLHPVQQAFIEEQAVQCGYCIPGLVIAAVSLLERNPKPTDVQIREELNRHLCRCGTYTRIVRAVRRAAEELHS